jgi:hypothetical protein
VSRARPSSSREALEEDREGQVSASDENGITIVEAPFGSDVYRQSLVLREAVLRTPLGLHLTAEELADAPSALLRALPRGRGGLGLAQAAR